MVTGVSGLLGSNTVVALQEAGYQVRGLVRAKSSLLAVAGVPGLELAYGSLLNEQELREAMEGCRYVVHAAAETRQWGVSRQAHWDTNVVGTMRMVRAAAGLGVEKFVQVSTASVFQPGSLGQPGTEQTECEPALAGTPYVSAKLAADRYIRSEVRDNGFPAVIVNPTFMIGPRDAAPSSGKMITHYLKSRWVFCPPGGKNFVHVRDVAAGIAGALEKGVVGEHYLLAGTNLSFREFFGIVGACSGVRRKLFCPSGRTLSGMGRMGEVLGRIRGSEMPFNAASMALLSRECYFTPRKAVTALGMPQTSIENAVAEYLDWQARHA